MNKKKYKVYAPIDWLQGYVRYGHFEGEIELSDEEVEKIEDNPSRLEHYLDDLNLVVDDWSINDRGMICKAELEEIPNEI